MAVQELGGEVDLGDGVVNVREPGGEELHPAGILGDRKIPLLQISVLPVQHHVPGSLIAEEVIAGPRP